MAPIVTLLSDFGLEDSYVAEVKGTILSLTPEATLVDITHLVPAQDVFRGALVLAAAAPRFPRGTVHWAVVDPGVGTGRRAVAVEVRGHRFVGPDNGLLSFALERLDAFAGTPSASPAPVPRPIEPPSRAVQLTRSRFWLPDVSSTFHGRDIFAPVAAYLAQGLALEEVGEPVESLLSYSLPRPVGWSDGTLHGQVIAADRFGNLLTSIRAEDLLGSKKAGQHGPEMDVEIAGRRITGLKGSYGEATGLIALVGSTGYLEIAVVNGNAARELGIGPGAEVVLRPREQR